ncbi:MAG TPA: hypothetical protein VM939_05915, partial [Gemmatimonadaceae bacterium]|nr:hypothetical protein [Gemmatimonadaceae bacterium]
CMTDQSAGTARMTALAAIERQERFTKLALFGAAVIEGILLAAILWVIDLSNPTQRLILLSTFLVYLPLGLGMLALASVNSRHTRSILMALQMIAEGRDTAR